MERFHDRTYVNENFLIIFDEINMIEEETIIIPCRLKDRINSADAYVAESEAFSYNDQKFNNGKNEDRIVEGDRDGDLLFL